MRAQIGSGARRAAQDMKGEFYTSASSSHADDGEPRSADADKEAMHVLDAGPIEGLLPQMAKPGDRVCFTWIIRAAGCRATIRV